MGSECHLLPNDNRSIQYCDTEELNIKTKCSNRTQNCQTSATAIWSLTWDVLHKTRSLGFFLIFYCI